MWPAVGIRSVVGMWYGWSGCSGVGGRRLCHWWDVIGEASLVGRDRRYILLVNVAWCERLCVSRCGETPWK